MMGKRCMPGWKIGRHVAILEGVVWPVIGTATAFALSRGAARWPLTSLAGAGMGVAVAWQRVFTDWVVCGSARSEADGWYDQSNFDREGARHAWFGRRGRTFDAYAIGSGNLPEDVVEGAGGLVLLLRDYTIPSTRENDPTYDRDFAELCHKRGYVAWGIVPLPMHESLQGVLVVLASRDEDASAAAQRMAALGAQDAICTDQRSMIMLGSRERFYVGPPAAHRQSMQTFGFFCA